MNTITWKNRALSVALAVIMVFSMLPLSVFAAGGAVAEVTIDGATTQYEDIDAAFAAAQEADSAAVKLLADVTIDHTHDDDPNNDTYGIELEKGNITLELNGKTISQRSGIARNKFYAYSAVFYLSVPEPETLDDYPTTLKATTSLTVQDSVGGGKIEQPNGGPAIVATFNSTLTVISGTIENTSTDDCDDESNGHMTPNCAVLVTGGGKAVIKGGTLSGMRGVAVTGYITKEETELIREYYGIEYSNELFGNELTVEGGEISGTGGHALIVYEKAKKIELSGGTFSSKDPHSIWVADSEPDGVALKGDAASLLADGYRYENNGAECDYSADGNGVVGNTTVALRPANEYAYIGADGKLTTQANCAEITAETNDISHGWYVLKGDVTVPLLNISEEVHLILCDGATLTVTDYLNVGQGSTLNLYWQSGGSGKLTAASIGVMGRVTAPARGMKQTPIGTSGVTLEKCLTHSWDYTQNSDDTHTAMCKLCGKAEAAESHKYESWTSTDADTHTGTCVCGATSTENHTLTLAPNADGLTHSTKCSKCGYATAAENHDFNKVIDSYKICDCGVSLAAEYNNQQYATLESAIKTAKNGGTVTLQAATVTENITIEDGTNVTIDLNGKDWTIGDMNGAAPVLIVKGGSVTVQNGTLMAGFTSKADTAVVVNGGSLFVGEGMTIQGGSDGDGSGGTRYLPAIEVQGGELTLSVGAKLDGGMKVSAEGKLLKDYLPAGTAFHQVLRDDTESVANGYVPELSGQFVLIVAAHSHSYNAEGKCACGFACHHEGGNSREASYFQKAKCAICGNEYGELATDTTPPTGRITVTERNWFETFLNTITFNLFFKEELTGKITATDDSYTQAGYDKNKHAVKIEYIVSDKSLTSAELTDWVKYDAAKGIDLTGERQYVVYARLTDHAGNEALLSTDGFVIDMTAPSIGDFTDGQEVHICSGRYTVSVEDANLKEVTVDGEKQTGNSITFKMAERNNTHTIVAKDKAGNTSTVTFTLHGGHNYNSETGVCENNCGAVAEVKLTDGTGTRAWGTYDAARNEIIRSNTPVTLTLLKDCGDKGGSTTQFSKDGLDLTIDLNGHDFGNASDQIAVSSQTAGGSVKLNLIGEGSFKPLLWLGRGAAFTVGENVTYVGGTKIYYDSSFGDKITDVSVSLKGGKYGEIDLTYRDKNGDTQSVGTLGDLLVPGYVFKTDVASLSAATDVEVEACAGHAWNNGECERCKLACTHNWVGSECTVCGYECLHSSVEERDGNTYCTEKCGAQMAVKVTNGDTETYYAKTFDRWNAENTLQTVLNDDAITPSGSTITLLADSLQAWAHVQRGKTITLDLNGKKLIETGNGICTANDNSKNKLIVTGTGISEENESAMHSRAFAVYGGTLEFDSGFGGEFHEVYVSGGTLTFADGQSATIHTLTIAGDVTITPLKSGKFGEIKIDEGASGVSVKAGSLLAMHYAFQKADGSYVPYDTVITSDKAIENVTVATCGHTGLPDSFTGTACPYCNTALVATVQTAAGKITGYSAFKDARAAANASSGCTLTLLADVSETLTVSANAAITLKPNGHTVSGNVIVQKNANLTATGGTFSGKINCVGTLNLTGCVLTGDLSVSGNATLTSCNATVSNPVSVNKGGTLTVKDGGNLTGVTVNNGGALELVNSHVSGTVAAKSGGRVTVSSGHIGTLTAENTVTLTLSGGNFTKITVSGKNLIDCLSGGFAFRDTNGIVDGRTPILSNVAVVAHPAHEHKWLITTHELVCACGHVKETDTDNPSITGISGGETYYGDTTFTVTDKNLHTVTVDGKPVTLTDGKHTILADNLEHTVVATDLAGNSTTVTVTVNKLYTVTLPSGTGYTVTGPDTVGHGQDYTFTVTIAEGYSATEYFTVGVKNVLNIVTPEPDSPGVYTYVLPGTEVTGSLTITVEGVADITAPDAKLTIGTNTFKSLLNSLTFGLFFKKTQTVTVTAADLGSGVDGSTAEYLVIDGSFGKDTMPTEGWTSFNMQNGRGSFSIEPNAMGSVYVRVKDKDGNLALINSDGVVVYTDSTADTERISFTRLSDKDVTFQVNLNGNWFDRLLISDGKTTSSINGIVSSDGTVTLKNEELRKLAAGEYTITVTYNPMGQKYVEAEGNDAPVATEVKLTVKKAARELEFSAPDAVYDGAAYDDLRISGRPATTVVHYKVKGADDSTYTTDAPKNVGSYTVRISVDADTDYDAAAFTKDFTISPKEVTITGTAVKSTKVYNGSAAAEIESIGTLTGVEDGDELTIVKGKANYADKNVGTAKTVTFTDFALSGSAKENYVLAAQPASVRADITAKKLTVEGLRIKTKEYDGTNTAEIDGTPGIKGVVDGDTLSLINGTPIFGNTAVGEHIAISFSTPFALAGDEVTVRNYTLIQPTGITANIVAWLASGSEYGVSSHEWINTDFTVTAKSGYQLSLTDTAVGDWKNALTASEETADGKLTFYVKNTDTGVISAAVTETYKIDKTAPTGSLQLNERTPFQKFISSITFGLFFKEDVTVKLTAQDEASGVKSVEYYKSDKALVLEEVKAVTGWTQGSSFGITAEDMARFVIYARITDNAGNVAYLSSNGAEFDTTAPEIVGVENNGIYYVTRRLAADDANLESVTVNDNPVEPDSPFDLVGDTDTAYTIVATDKAGNVTTCTVTMKPISDITDAIKDITEENVKSSDADAIDAVTQRILDLAAESDEEIIGEEQWNKLTEAAASCKKLGTRMAEVAAEIARITDAVGSYEIAKVTSADKADIEQIITDIDALLGGNNLTDSERAALESLKETAAALLGRIAAAKTAAESDEILAVEDITKDNVTLGDKDALEKAKKALEKALDDFDGNYTEEERKSLNDRLNAVKAALDAIGNAEKAAEEIKKLPSADDVKLTDKDEIERINTIIDALTENEKTMLGEDTLGKLEALNKKLTELADNAQKPTSPTTGDAGNLAMWIALLFIGGGVTAGVAVAGKKKKQQD